MDRQTVTARWNAVFRALAADPRREIVLSLSDASPDDAVRLPDAAMPPGATVARETLRLRLHHTHLPLLADNGYVEWSTGPLVAERGPAFSEVQSVMEAVVENADRLPAVLVEGHERLDGSGEGG